MNRKWVFILCGISAIVVTAVLVFYLRFKSGTLTSPISNTVPTQTVVEELATWTDPAQFSFQYPKTLVLNPHNEDKENYAHVEITSATHSGNLIIWVKDTTVQTIDGWISQQKVKNAIDSSLDNVPAKKVLTAADINKLTISAIQGGYLYQVEANLADSDFWNKILDTVTSSFKFTTPVENTNQEQGSSSSVEQGSDIGSSDEEVIE